MAGLNHSVCADAKPKVGKSPPVFVSTSCCQIVKLPARLTVKLAVRLTIRLPNRYSFLLANAEDLVTLSMEDFIQYAGPRARKNNRLAQYREDIDRLRQAGASYAQIKNYLFDRRGLAVSKEAVRKYCKRYIDGETRIPTFSADVRRPAHTRSAAGELAFEHSAAATTPQSNESQPRAQIQTRLQLPPLSEAHEFPASNVASESPAFQPTSPESASKIDVLETVPLIPPGFFGPPSRLNPPYDPYSNEHRAMLDAQEKDTFEEGAYRADGPRGDKRNLII